MFFKKRYKIGKYHFEKEAPIELYDKEIKKLRMLCREFVDMEIKFVRNSDKPVDKLFHNFATFNLHALDSEVGVTHFLANLVEGTDPNDRFIVRLTRLMIDVEIAIDPKILSVIKGRVYNSLIDVYFFKPEELSTIIDRFPPMWISPFLQSEYQKKMFLV